MGVKIAQFCSALFLAILLGASLAHLYELPNKMELSRVEYLIVQQIYRGWALLGLAVAGALASTIAQAVLLRREPRRFGLTLVAVACILAAQVVFWVFTFPVNQVTDDWRVLPADWIELRRRWEYSHAAGAGLGLIAHAAVVLSMLVDR